MTVKINGDNSFAKPAITGSDVDSGVRINGNDVSVVRDSAERIAFDANGARIIRDAESFSGFQRTGAASTNDYIGSVNWQAQNSAGTNFEYSKLNTQITDNTAGSENSKFYIQTRLDGTMHSALELVNGVHNFPRLPYCTGGQNAGWTTFQASPAADYGILPSNGSFFTNANSGFYAGTLINGYRVIHATHAGTYLFMLTLYRNAGFDARVNLRRNNSHEFGFIETQGSQANDHTLSMTCIETLAAGDYVNYRFSGTNGGQLYTGDNHTTLSIVKIG